MPPLKDARSVRSQQSLRQALLDLLAVTPFEQITLGDIATRAGVSYPTFYRHFATKEELLADMARQEAEAFMAMPSDPASNTGPGARICLYIADRRALWRTLLAPGAAAIFREEFILQGQRNAARGPRLNPRFPASIASRVFAGGLFEIIAWWFAQPDDYPQSEIAEMLETLVINPVINRLPG